RDLVALREVGIEVMLPGEDASLVYPAVEAQPGEDPEFDCAAVDDRERAREAEAHRADVSVGLRAELRRVAAEHLGPCLELYVNLQPDNWLVSHSHPPTRSRPARVRPRLGSAWLHPNGRR